MSNTEHNSIPRRIAKLKRLAKHYFPLKKGDLIEKHTEMLRVCDIRGSKHKDDHPHRNMRIYISRRSLKHFVEERKEDLIKNHSEEEALEGICFALDVIQETVTNFDKYEFETGKHFYVKDYSSVGRPSVRILLHKDKDSLEICSIHFTKRRN